MTTAPHREYPPPAALAGAVRCFWHDRRDAGTFDVLPDGYVELVFPFGALHDGSGCPCMVGLLLQPLTLRAGGPVELLSVRCYPWAVHELLGFAPGEGVGAVDHPVAALAPSLRAHLRAGRVEEAVALLAGFLGAARPTVDATLSKAGAALHGAHGALPVSAVAAAAHSTVRTLERKFRHAAGRTVKDVAGAMRFEAVRNRLVLDPRASLAALAQEFGFTDQPHLTREFRRYSGMTPAAFAQRIAPILSRSYKPLD